MEVYTSTWNLTMTMTRTKKKRRVMLTSRLSSKMTMTKRRIETSHPAMLQMTTSVMNWVY